jgi:hypothetical protein
MLRLHAQCLSGYYLPLVNTSLWCTKQHAINTDWGTQISLQEFFTSATDGGDFTSGKRVTSTHWQEAGWTSLGVTDSRKTSTSAGNRIANSRLPILFSSHYSNWAIPARTRKITSFINIKQADWFMHWKVCGYLSTGLVSPQSDYYIRNQLIMPIEATKLLLRSCVHPAVTSSLLGQTPVSKKLTRWTNSDVSKLAEPKCSIGMQ